MVHPLRPQAWNRAPGDQGRGPCRLGARGPEGPAGPSRGAVDGTGRAGRGRTKEAAARSSAARWEEQPSPEESPGNAPGAVAGGRRSRGPPAPARWHPPGSGPPSPMWSPSCPGTPAGLLPLCVPPVLQPPLEFAPPPPQGKRSPLGLCPHFFWPNVSVATCKPCAEASLAYSTGRRWLSRGLSPAAGERTSEAEPLPPCEATH